MLRSKPEPTQPATVLTANDLARQRTTGRIVGLPVTNVECVVCGTRTLGRRCAHPGMSARQLRRYEAGQARLAAAEAARRQPPPCAACGLHTPIGRGHVCKVVADQALEKAKVPIQAQQAAEAVNALKAAGLKVVSDG